RILLALAISLFIHIAIWAAYEINRDLHWMRHVPSIASKAIPAPKIQRIYEEPLEFVTVQAPSAEAPKNTRYFSTQNSIASDDSVKKTAEVPKLNGKQTDMAATADVARPQFSKSPDGADTHQANQSAERSGPRASETAGDMMLGKPDEQQKQPRPRTLKEAYAEMAKRLPSLTMREEGGAGHHARSSAFDVKVTGYADYDQRFAETVDNNWYNELDSHQFAEDRVGKVVLYFQLNYDGTISQMRVGESTVGDLLAYVCEKAVLDGAPYERWTENMRLQLGDYINVEYIFEY
ncbi:MAG: hypothetical protein ACREFR_17310, partial [Limisphaerales bacterium]